MESILTTFDGWINNVTIVNYSSEGILYKKGNEKCFIPFSSINMIKTEEL